MGALWIQGIKGLFKRKNLCLFAAVIFLGVLAGFLTRKEDVQREAGERVSIGIVNHDTSIYSKMLLSFYQENGLFTSYVSVYLGEEEEIFSWFEEGKLDMYLVIPKDFADSMTSRQSSIICERGTISQYLDDLCRRMCIRGMD